MSTGDLARSYLLKARWCLEALEVLLRLGDHSDVVREAQEIVELALKGMFRKAGLDAPRWHDVGPILRKHADRFPKVAPADLERLVAASAWLRKEREFASTATSTPSPPSATAPRKRNERGMPRGSPCRSPRL